MRCLWVTPTIFNYNRCFFMPRLLSQIILSFFLKIAASVFFLFHSYFLFHSLSFTKRIERYFFLCDISCFPFSFFHFQTLFSALSPSLLSQFPPLGILSQIQFSVCFLILPFPVFFLIFLGTHSSLSFLSFIKFSFAVFFLHFLSQFIFLKTHLSFFALLS